MEKLFEAIRTGSASEVAHLLDADPGLLTARDPQTHTSAILTAVYHGKSDIVRLFLDRNVQLDIFEAAALGALDRVRELAPHHKDDTAEDGFTPLSLACYFDQPQVAEFLLEAGADVNQPSANAMRIQPIHAATARRSAELAEALLNKGADPNARQQMGYVPLHAAAQNGDEPTLNVLLKAGADPTIPNDDGRTAADFAAAAGHDAIARRLRTAAAATR